MTSPTSEFSRPVLLQRLGTGAFRQRIVATEAERAALAERFGLLSLDRLCADVDLTRRGGEMVLLRAAFEAEFVQECVVTLDPVPGTMAEEFGVLYGPLALEEAAMGTLGDTIAFEPLEGDAIDIGEAVAQEFSLALPPFPRSVDAPAEAAPPPDDANPFAALTGWRGRLGDDRGNDQGNETS
jgi:uncharacterized metal-binding protein YceD (DUF177 family)